VSILLGIGLVGFIVSIVSIVIISMLNCAKDVPDEIFVISWVLLLVSILTCIADLIRLIIVNIE